MMLRMFRVLLCGVSKFSRFLVTQSLLLLRVVNCKVGIKQKHIINVHVFRRVDTHNITVPNQKPLWRMTAFDIGWSESLSKIQPLCRSNYEVSFLAVVASFCGKTHAQG